MNKEKIVDRIFELEIEITNDLSNSNLQKEQDDLLEQLYIIDSDLYDEISSEISF